LIENAAATDPDGIAVTDPESEARTGCADAWVAVAVAEMAEVYEEAAVSGRLDTHEVHNDAEGFNVKTTLFDV
jgi:hypothetical protein